MRTRRGEGRGDWKTSSQGAAAPGLLRPGHKSAGLKAASVPEASLNTRRSDAGNAEASLGD